MIGVALGTINLRSGETVYNQGDSPTALFVVIEGDVCGFVVDSDGSNGRMLFEASSGAVLGGVAVLGDVPMRETVSCLTDTVLAVYPKVLFSEVATVDSDEMADEIRMITTSLGSRRVKIHQGQAMRRTGV